MCGILGILSFERNSFSVQRESLKQMLDTMAHRGPDGEGIWISHDQKIGFGHRRLSILDLSSSADQPMSDEEETIQVIFNGEIYNHADIRKELIEKGYSRWKTDHSDTEVIVHAFKEWGIESIHKFRGMFAIAIWDEKKKELWLVRDRIGIKPLYYSIHHGRICFASEIKALLKDPEQKRAVHEEALYHFLSFLTTPSPQTLFNGIQKLPPATWLRVKEDGTLLERRYWDVWDHAKPLVGLSEEEISKKILEELRVAVKLRKISDVPVGVFLSGGIDSSTNTALFSEGASDQKVQTFSIGYEGNYKSYQNELHFARKMANQVNAQHSEQLLNMEDLLSFLPQMIHLQDEPIADPVCVPVYYVSKLARESGVTVCQVGEGADELFWGYQGWKSALMLQRWNDLPVPNFLKKVGLIGLRMMGKENSLHYERLRRGSLNLPIFWGGAESFTEMEKKKLLSPRLKERFKGFSSWEAIAPIRRRFESKAWEKSHLHWMSYLDLNFRLPELLLMRVDKMSMGVSLEARVPFLDHKFVELAMSIPESIKTKNGINKYILKKAVRGLIPDELIDRPKQGFGVPVYEWVFDKLGDRMREEFNQFCKETDFFDRKEVMRYLDEGRGPQAWYLLNFVLWWKQWFRS